jgi:hypothetical protein
VASALALLIAFIVLVELAPWRLSPRAGWWIVGMGAPALVVGAVIAFWLAEERESKRLAVKTAFLSPPDDIVAHTRGARAGTMIELLAGIGLLGAYLSRFFRDAPRAER